MSISEKEIKISKLAYNLSITAKIPIGRAIEIERDARENIVSILNGAKFGLPDPQEWMCEAYFPLEFIAVNHDTCEMVVFEPGNSFSCGQKNLSIVSVASLVIDNKE